MGPVDGASLHSSAAVSEMAMFISSSKKGALLPVEGRILEMYLLVRI